MKKPVRALILSLGILVSTGISSAVYAQDCKTVSADTLKQICAKYGIEATKGLTVKPQAKTPCKTTPVKAVPAKATPTKAVPAKATPVKSATTTPAPSKATTPTTTESSKLEKEVVTLVNQERAKVGLASLKNNSQLASVARTKSQDMVDKNYFDHTSPTYGSPFDMMKHFGITYTAAGENIAMGQESAASVMKSWMNSPGHKANILSKDFTEIGVGAVKNKSGAIYWTQEFIGK